MSIKLAIVGTRVLAHADDERWAAARIQGAIQKLMPDVIISGGANGIDTLAADIAQEWGFNELDGTLVVHRPTVRRFHGPGGYRERDGFIAADCTHLLRISCTEAITYGSGWTADEAERLGKLVVRFSPCRYSA